MFVGVTQESSYKFFMKSMNFLDYLDDVEICGGPSWKGPIIQKDIKKGKSVSVSCPGGCIIIEMVQ